MPSDPNELMSLAAISNGLIGSDIQPWHLKASFQSLGEDGAVKDQGTLEEFWAGLKKSRVTYTTTGVSQTFYQTEQGRFRSGPEAGVPLFAVEALNAVVSPLPPPKALEHLRFEKQDRDTGGAKLVCLHSSNASAVPAAGLYCIEAGKPVLRITANGPSQTILNKIASFENRHVPLDVGITMLGRTVLKAQIDTLELLKTVDESEFIPPRDAVPAPTQENIPAAVAQGQLMKHVPPEYPLIAMRSRISGTVVLEIVIDKQGHVRDLQALGGPAPLQQAAIDAVKQWSYKPYLLNGEVVEVRTLVNVTFNLGSR